jgi:hypothetical protein
MQTELVAREQAQLEVFADGTYGLKRYVCTVPEAVSEVIGRHLSAVESQQSPQRKWWLHYSYEVKELRATRKELFVSYRRFGRWQFVTIGCGLTFEAAHGAIALLIGASMPSLAPLGGSALAVAGTCAGILRYLTKEKAATMKSVEQITSDLARCQSMAASGLRSFN